MTTINVSTPVSNCLHEALPFVKQPITSIPVQTEKSSKIFAGIREFITSSTQAFLKVKPIDKSVKELQTIFTSLEDAKKNGTLNLALNISLLIASALAVTLGTISIFVNLSYTIPVAISAIFITSIVVGAIGICVAGYEFYSDFNIESNSKKEIASIVDEIQINYGQLKAYFTDNKQSFIDNINAEKKQKNNELKVFSKLSGNYEAQQAQLKAEIETLDKSLIELTTLHKFYTK